MPVSIARAGLRRLRPDRRTPAKGSRRASHRCRRRRSRRRRGDRPRRLAELHPRPAGKTNSPTISAANCSRTPWAEASRSPMNRRSRRCPASSAGTDIDSTASSKVLLRAAIPQQTWPGKTREKVIAMSHDFQTRQNSSRLAAGDLSPGRRRDDGPALARIAVGPGRRFRRAQPEAATAFPNASRSCSWATASAPIIGGKGAGAAISSAKPSNRSSRSSRRSTSSTACSTALPRARAFIRR